MYIGVFKIVLDMLAAVKKYYILCKNKQSIFNLASVHTI